MKARKQIPALQPLQRYDAARLVVECAQFGLFDPSRWQELNFADQKPRLKSVIQMHTEYYQRWFNTSGGEYGDIFLNEIDYELAEQSYTDEEFNSARSRARVITSAEKLKVQRNAELLFKPKLRERYRGSYLEEVYHDIGSKFPGGPGRAKVSFMAPRSNVGRHIDLDSTLVVKVHIPLVTNDECFFYVGNPEQKLHMPADGTAQILNIGLPHRVENNGDQARFHFIMNVYQQDLNALSV